jgi:hypothetical protein
VALWKGLGGLHFNQDGIKRGGVAQTGKFFCSEYIDIRESKILGNPRPGFVIASL